MASSQNPAKRGNSGFIARKLAEALGSFCEIDESMVRSRLLNPKKSKISLKDVRLKPRVIRQGTDQALEMNGSIDEVLFRWKWNVMKGSIKKSTLFVKGAKITIKPISVMDAAVMHAMERISSNTSLDSTSIGDNGSEKKQSKFVKNILDHFMLHVEDLELHLDLPVVSTDPFTSSEQTLVVYGNHIELESLGKLKTGRLKKNKGFRKRSKENNRSDPLMQQLRIGSISAKLINTDRERRKTVLPMIDPFRYSARIKRFHGERFAPFSEGVELDGEVLPIADRTSIVPIFSSFSEEDRDDSNMLLTKELLKKSSGEIEIYADDEGIETTLNQVISNSWDEDMLFQTDEARDIGDAEEEEVPIVYNGINLYLGSLQTIALFKTISMFSVETKADESDDELEFEQNLMRPGALVTAFPKAMNRSSRNLDKTSTYNFPLRNIQVVLPNRAIVVAQECALKIRADGTKCILEGIGGVLVDGEEILDYQSFWSVNISNKYILLQPKDIMTLKSAFATDVPKTNFDLGLKHITRLSGGISEILRLRRLISKPSSSEGGVRSPSGWSLKVNGTTNIKF